MIMNSYNSDGKLQSTNADFIIYYPNLLKYAQSGKHVMNCDPPYLYHFISMIHIWHT